MEKQEAKIKEYINLKDVLTLKDMYNVRFPFTDKISIWKGDISTLHIDAIVCEDNDEREEHTKKNFFMRFKSSVDSSDEAKIFKVKDEPHRYVIKINAPIVRDSVTDIDCLLLKRCYESCLELATFNDVESIAFGCISADIAHFPHNIAALTACKTVYQYLLKNVRIKRVVFCVPDDEVYRIYKDILV